MSAIVSLPGSIVLYWLAGILLNTSGIESLYITYKSLYVRVMATYRAFRFLSAELLTHGRNTVSNCNPFAL